MSSSVAAQGEVHRVWNAAFKKSKEFTRSSTYSTNGRTVSKKHCQQSLGSKKIDFYSLYQLCISFGGFSRIKDEQLWVELYMQSEYFKSADRPSSVKVQNNSAALKDVVERVHDFVNSQQHDNEELPLHVASSSTVDANEPVLTTADSATISPQMVEFNDENARKELIKISSVALKGLETTYLGDTGSGDPITEEILKVTTAIANFKAKVVTPDVKSIVLLGATGVGKTFLLNAILQTTETPRHEYGTLEEFEAFEEARSREQRHNGEETFTASTTAFSAADAGADEDEYVTEDDEDEEDIENAEQSTVEKVIQLIRTDAGNHIYHIKPSHRQLLGLRHEIDAERIALEGVEAYADNKSRSSFAAKYGTESSDKTDFFRNFKPFILASAKPDEEKATTSHNLTVRFGRKWHFAVKYETLADLRRALGRYDFRGGESKQEDDARVEHERMKELLYNVSVLPTSASQKRKKQKTTESSDSKASMDGDPWFPQYYDPSEYPDDDDEAIGSDIQFKESILDLAGKTLVITGEGEDSLEDRVSVRYMLNGILFYGLEKYKTWPNVGSPEDMRESGTPDTFIIKSVVLYAPSHLLEQSIQFLDVPGGNDVDANRQLRLKRALEDCDGVMVVSPKDDINSENSTAELLDQVIAPRLYNGKEKRLVQMRYFKMSERTAPLDKDQILKSAKPIGDKLRQNLEKILVVNHARRGREHLETARFDVIASKVKAMCADSHHIYPLLYTSLLRNCELRLSEPDKCHQAMEAAQGREIFRFFLDVAKEDLSAEIENLKTVLVASESLNFASLKSQTRMHANFVRPETLREGRRLFNQIWTTSHLLLDTSLPFDDASLLSAVEGLCGEYIEMLDSSMKTVIDAMGKRKSKTIESAFLRDSEKVAYAKKVIPAQGLYFADKATRHSFDLAVLDGLVDTFEQEILERARQTISSVFTFQQPEVAERFHAFLVNQRCTAFLEAKFIRGERLREEVLRDVCEQLGKLFFTVFAGMTDLNDIPNQRDVERLFKSLHVQFVEKVPLAVLRGVKARLQKRLNKIKDMKTDKELYACLSECFQSSQRRRNIEEIFRRTVAETLSGVVRVQNALNAQERDFEVRMMQNFVFEKALGSGSLPFPPEDNRLSTVLPDSIPHDTAKILHEAICKSNVSLPRLDTLLRDTIGLRGLKGQIFCKLAPFWPMMVECVFSGKTNDFERMFGMPLSKFTSPFKLTTGDTPDAGALSKCLSEKPFQVPLLIGACEMFDCIFRVNSGLFYVTFVRARTQPVPAVEISWNLTSGWSTTSSPNTVKPGKTRKKRTRLVDMGTRNEKPLEMQPR